MISDQKKRELKFWDSIAITVGIVIGVGIFRVPTEVAKYIGSPSLILLAWLLGGAISILGVLCYAELSSRFPETGGTYVFLREAYGEFVGFLYGWAEFAINRAATIAAVAYIFAAYLKSAVPFGLPGEKWLAFGIIFLLTLVNGIGVHVGVRVQHVLSFFKAASLLVMTGLIFWFAKAVTPTPSFFSVSEINLGSVGHFAPAMVAILWTFGGWHESTFMSGEFRDTKKELPRALIISGLMITGLYFLINAAYLKALSPDQMVQSKAIAADVLKKLFGETGKLAMTAIVLMSSLGALNSNILTGGRIPFSVAQNSPRLKWLGKVDSRFHTPLRSLVLNGIWACVLVLWGNFEQILFFNAFEIWLFFILVGVSVFILRRKNNAHSGFSMVGYPFVPILFTLVSFWLCWTTIQHAPREAFIGFVIILIGGPLYFLAKHSFSPPYKSIV